MPIDFEIPAEAKAIREKVRKWVHEECIPAEKELDTKPLAEVLGPLRTKARARGLWCPWVPKEYGGMGLGPLANALVQMELGESMLGALSMNTQGPDDASMMTILAHGTDYQKEKFLKPLLNGDKRICFSMTEKAAGADATGMQTTAVKDGNENYILNGEKWFSSSASVADMALVMAKTDPNAPRHKQYSTFLVELPNPGYRIKRNVANMAIEGPHDDILHGGHSEIEIKDLVVPADNLVGGEATALRWASTASPMAACVTACTTSPRRSARSTWRWPMSPSARPSANCSRIARRCSSCSPIAPANSISAG
jgi:acyl-CoA dehydrogenase